MKPHDPANCPNPCSDHKCWEGLPEKVDQSRLIESIRKLITAWGKRVIVLEKGAHVFASGSPSEAEFRGASQELRKCVEELEFVIGDGREETEEIT